MIGNNSCGAHSAAYGKTVDNVEALEVMLYDGTRLSLGAGARMTRTRRRIARGGREGEIYPRLRELATVRPTDSGARISRNFRDASPATISTS